MIVADLPMGEKIGSAHSFGVLLEQVAVVVAGNRGEVQRHQPVRSPARMQAAGEQIAEVHHGVDALPFDVFEHGVERRDVAVDIGNEGYSHVHRIAAPAMDCNRASRGK